MSRDDGFAAVERPSFQEALRFWCKLGWISFGGTAVHIAIMHYDLVVKKRWIVPRWPMYTNSTNARAKTAAPMVSSWAPKQ